jgi:hypothetical protein
MIIIQREFGIACYLYWENVYKRDCKSLLTILRNGEQDCMSLINTLRNCVQGVCRSLLTRIRTDCMSLLTTLRNASVHRQFVGAC